MPSFSPLSLQDADTLSLQDASTAMGNGPCAPQHAVIADRHDPIAAEQQWLRDLATLERIEFQNECFFDAMGAMHRGEGAGR